MKDVFKRGLVCLICGFGWVVFQYIFIALMATYRDELNVNSQDLIQDFSNLFKNKYTFIVLGSVLLIDVFLIAFVNLSFKQHPKDKSYLRLLYISCILLFGITLLSNFPFDNLNINFLLFFGFSILLGIQKAIHFYKPANVF